MLPTLLINSPSYKGKKSSLESTFAFIVILERRVSLQNTLLIRERPLHHSKQIKSITYLRDKRFLITAMKLCYAQTARPGALGRRRKRWRQTIHMVSTITVVTEQQLILVWFAKQLISFQRCLTGCSDSRSLLYTVYYLFLFTITLLRYSLIQMQSDPLLIFDNHKLFLFFFSW